MRRQDELLALYPGQAPANQKLILSEVDRLALAFDSEELMQFLLREGRSADPLVRHQALFTLQVFQPGFIRKKYGVSPMDRGIWSSYAADPVKGLGTETLGQDVTTEGEARRSTALNHLAGAAEVVAGLTGHSSGEVQALARLTLAQLPVKKSVDRLMELHGRCPADLLTLTALMRVGGDEKLRHRLLASLKPYAVTGPDHLLAAAALPRDAVASWITEMAGRATCHGRINLAIALRHATLADPREVIGTLSAFGEAWVDVYCLRALEATQDLTFVDQVVAIHRRNTHPFVRAQALRAAGGLEGTQALEFCMKQLQDDSDAVKAQALESLVRLRCDRDALSSATAPLVKNPSLRVRVNALLANVAAGEDDAPGAVSDLLFSNDPVARIEGAYCLGYWQSRRSLSLLATLATDDPNPLVAAQAVKSVSRYPAATALGTLLPIVRDPESEVAHTAGRVLARYEGAEATEVSAALVEALAAKPGPTARALMLRTLGAVAGKVGWAPGGSPLAAGLWDEDPRVVLGAIEGWKTYGSSVGTDALESLDRIGRSADPTLAPRAHVAAFLLGRVEAGARLADGLKSTDAPTVVKYLESTMELGLLVSEVVPRSRFPGLDRRLTEDNATRPSTGRTAALAVHGRCWNVAERSAQDYISALPDPEFATRAAAEVRVEKHDVQDAPAASKRTTDRVPAVSGPARSTGDALGRLKKHLAVPALKTAVAAGKMARGLDQNTYLVGQLGGVHGSGWRAVLESVTQIPSFLMANKILMIPPAVLLLLLGIFTFGRPEPKVRRAAPPRRIGLSVIQVAGMATARTPPTTLAAGDAIEVDDWVQTGPDATLRCRTPSGGTIEIQSSSRLKLTSITPNLASLRVAVTQGNFVFDVSHRGDITVDVGSIRIQGDQVKLVLRDVGSRPTVRTEWGDATVTRDGGATDHVLMGQTRPLDGSALRKSDPEGSTR